MSPHLKYGLLFLLLCTIVFLIFVNFVENNVTETNYVLQNIVTINNNESSLNVIRDSSNNNNIKLRNIKNLDYVISANCRSSAVIWIVTSFAGDAVPRSALRRAYTDEELIKLDVTRVFLLGLLDNAAQRKTAVTQDALINESERFNDIVQGNFNEAYRNLTYKHLMGLKWSTDNCPKARYIVKQDDDIVVNLYDILNRLNLFKKKEDILAGYVLKNMRAIREPANKWFVTQDEFKGDFYPDFLSGWLYIVSYDVAKKIVKRCYEWEKLLWIDDAFLTGIIRHELNIRLIDIHEMYTTDYRFLSCCIRGKLKKLKCEYSVGPNGGKVELQLAFRDFAEFCENKCLSRSPRLSVGKTCVVEYEESRVQMGNAKIEPIQFL